MSSTQPNSSKSTSMGLPGPRSSAAASVNTSVNTWYLARHSDCVHNTCDARVHDEHAHVSTETTATPRHVQQHPVNNPISTAA